MGVRQPPPNFIRGLQRQGRVAGPEASQPCAANLPVPLPSLPAAPRSDTDLWVHSPARGTVTHPCRAIGINPGQKLAAPHTPSHPASLDLEHDLPTGYLTPHQPALEWGCPPHMTPLTHAHTHTHTHTHGGEGTWGCTGGLDPVGLGGRLWASWCHLSGLPAKRPEASGSPDRTSPARDSVCRALFLQPAAPRLREATSQHVHGWMICNEMSWAGECGCLVTGVPNSDGLCCQGSEVTTAWGPLTQLPPHTRPPPPRAPSPSCSMLTLPPCPIHTVTPSQPTHSLPKAWVQPVPPL